METLPQQKFCLCPLNDNSSGCLPGFYCLYLYFLAIRRKLLLLNILYLKADQLLNHRVSSLLLIHKDLSIKWYNFPDNNYGTALFQGKNGNIWVGTNRKLFYLENKARYKFLFLYFCPLLFLCYI